MRRFRYLTTILAVCLLFSACGRGKTVSVADSVTWAEDWQTVVPLTDGELRFKDYAAVYAQLSDAERREPWTQLPYEVKGIGYFYSSELYDDMEALLNVHPESWCVPDGGEWEDCSSLVCGLVWCAGYTEQQTTVKKGDILEPWKLVGYRWESGTDMGARKSVTIYAKPGTFDYDIEQNRGAAGDDVLRLNLEKPGSAAHVFVGDMDSRIGRAKLAIRMEDGRCSASMLLDETGYWVTAAGLTQEEVTALLLSIVNGAPKSGANGNVNKILRERAETRGVF